MYVLHIKGQKNLGQSDKVPMYSKYTAHVGLNGGQSLMAGFFVYRTYTVRKIGPDQTKLRVSIYSK